MQNPSVYTLKAFSIIAALIDNTRAVVSPVGELSPLAITYSREKEYISNSHTPGHTLVIFSSEDAGEPSQVDPVEASELLKVNSWMYGEAMAGRFSSSPDTARSALIQEYGNQFEVWNVGTMVMVSSNVWMPSYIELRLASDDTRSYRLWYATEQFEQQFDESELKVVPPVADIDVFFEARTEIERALAAMTHDLSVERIMDVKEGYPETFLQSNMYEWFDPLSPTVVENRIPTYWTIVGYGIAGRNDDSIKEAIRDFILENSDYPKEEWMEIFPEIFKSTEFVFIPHWGKYSIPNRELQSGLYSSVTNLRVGVQALVDHVRGEDYTEEYISEHGEIFGFGYKGLSVSVIGGPHNRDGINTVTLRYSDYLNVDTTHVDFSRMSPETRRFVLILTEMMSIAESMTPDSTMPIGYMRLFRDDRLYVSRTVDRFQLVVLSKYSHELAASAVEPPVIGG